MEDRKLIDGKREKNHFSIFIDTQHEESYYILVN